MFDWIAETLLPVAWIGPLLARLAVGTPFLLSGKGKIFTAAGHEKMTDTMREAGVPAPELNAWLVAGVELVGGALLVLGAFTPLSSALLAAVMVVALATVVLPGIEAEGACAWLSEVLYVPETLYLVILFWLLLVGPGPISLDAILG